MKTNPILAGCILGIAIALLIAAAAVCAKKGVALVVERVEAVSGIDEVAK